MRHWTKAELQDAIAMRKAGLRLKNIARHLVRTRASVAKMLDRVKVTRPRIILWHVLPFLIPDHDPSEVAKKVGLSRVTVISYRHILKKRGYKIGAIIGLNETRVRACYAGHASRKAAKESA